MGKGRGIGNSTHSSQNISYREITETCFKEICCHPLIQKKKKLLPPSVNLKSNSAFVLWPNPVMRLDHQIINVDSNQEKNSFTNIIKN